MYYNFTLDISYYITTNKFILSMTSYYLVL